MDLGHEQFTTIQEQHRSYEIEPLLLSSRVAVKYGRIIPLDIHHRRYAKDIVKILGGGFEWEDLGSIFLQCYTFLEEFPLLSNEMRSDAAIAIFQYVIDYTDSSYRPYEMNKVLLKNMLTPFIRGLSPDNLNRLVPESTIEGAPTDADIVAYESQILRPFKGKFDWSSLSTVVYCTTNYVSQFRSLSYEDKCRLCYRIVAFAIEKMDAPYVLEHFADDIFNRFSQPIMRELIRKMHKESSRHPRNFPN